MLHQDAELAGDGVEVAREGVLFGGEPDACMHASIADTHAFAHPESRLGSRRGAKRPCSEFPPRTDLAAELMLRQKGVDYRRVDLVAVLHRGVLRVLGFPGITVPALRIDGRRVQGTRAIAEALDELRPGAPLVPDPAVVEAEAWADDDTSRSPAGWSGTR